MTKFIVMLDVDGVLNNLDDTKAHEFMQMINTLRRQLNIDQTIIFLSTHAYDTNAIKQYLNIFNKYIVDGINIGKSFYLFGSYDYKSDAKEELGSFYNYNKTNVFEQNYLDSDVKYFWIIDDTIDPIYSLKYKDSLPMAILKPSQRGILRNSSNIYSTNEFAFKGVINLMNRFLLANKDKSLSDLFNDQRNCLLPIEYVNFAEICCHRKYELLKKYLELNTLDDDTYILILNYLLFNQKEAKTDELVIINHLIDTINNKIKNKTLIKEKTT